MTTQRIVTRFAPSPTGLFHAGSYRTAVFAYLFARHSGGMFILRIEDTDRTRSKKEYEDNILETLSWLGVDYDFMHRQSEWAGEHEFVLRSLVETDRAYVSREDGDDGAVREVIRFRNPGKPVTFFDTIRGDITMDTTELGDFVIAKSFTEPVWHLAVVVDDALTGVNYIIRGDDHIANTPRQILLYEALGANLPRYAHLPLVLASDRSKLSKRKGARAVSDYRGMGFLPEAILNYIAMLGWHPGTDEEVFTKEELIERFTLEQVQKSGAIFDETKLRWFNREHMLRMDSEQFTVNSKKYFSLSLLEKLEKTGRLEALMPIIRERIETLGDIRDMEAVGEFVYFVETPVYEKEQLLWKKEPDSAATCLRLKEAARLLSDINEADWNMNSIKETLWSFAEAEGKGNVLWPLRFALTGKEKSPDPFTVAGILGRDETEQRIRHAIELLSKG